MVPDAAKHNRTWVPFFTIGVTYTPITENFEKDLRDIATKNRRGINYLKNAPITSLITLQLHALKSDLKPALAVKARSLIAKTLRLNHQRYIHAYPTFKVPTSTIGSSEYRELIFYMVRSVNHDHELQQLLLSNTRIISTKHRSIADMIHNHIALPKRNPPQPPRSVHAHGTSTYHVTTVPKTALNTSVSKLPSSLIHTHCPLLVNVHATYQYHARTSRPARSSYPSGISLRTLSRHVSAWRKQTSIPTQNCAPTLMTIGDRTHNQLSNALSFFFSRVSQMM